MLTDMWRKGLVIGTILLFVGASFLPTLIRNVKADNTDSYTVLWQIDLPKISYFASYKADSGDTDGDGKDEIALIPNDIEYGGLGDADPLYLIDDDGTIIWSKILNKEQCCIAMEDYDLDGRSEIFVGASDRNYYGADGHIWAYEGNGDLIWEFIDTEDYGFWPVVPSRFVFYNIDSDPDLELIASNCGYPNKNCYAIDNDGSLIWRYDRNEVQDCLIGDFNDDGMDEIILLTNLGRMVYNINPFNGNVIWSTQLINYNFGSVGDLTGDGIDDLCVVSQGHEFFHEDRVYAIRNDGVILWSKLVNDNYGRYPILEDIDNDGSKDIILSEDNRILAWKNDGSSLLWESFAPYDFWNLWRFDIDADGQLDIIFFAEKAVYSVSKDGVISKVFDLSVSDNWRVPWSYHGKVTSEKSHLTARLYSSDTNGNGIMEFFIEEVFSDYVRISIIEPVRPVVEIMIDIKPGSYPNSINPNKKGLTPVAILTNETFDSGNVDVNTVLFLDASPDKWAMEDIDDDGDIDMSLKFKTQELNFSLVVDEGDDYPYAYLTGQTNTGESIEGKDTIRLIGYEVIESIKNIIQILTNRFKFLSQLLSQII